MAVQARNTYDFLSGIPGVPPWVLNQVFPHFCVLCGFYPSHVCLDGNRKASFNLKNSDLTKAQDAAGTSVPVAQVWQQTFASAFSYLHSATPLPVFDAGATGTTRHYRAVCSASDCADRSLPPLEQYRTSHLSVVLPRITRIQHARMRAWPKS